MGAQRLAAGVCFAVPTILLALGALLAVSRLSASGTSETVALCGVDHYSAAEELAKAAAAACRTVNSNDKAWCSATSVQVDIYLAGASLAEAATSLAGIVQIEGRLASDVPTRLRARAGLDLTRISTATRILGAVPVVAQASSVAEDEHFAIPLQLQCSGQWLDGIDCGTKGSNSAFAIDSYVFKQAAVLRGLDAALISDTAPMSASFDAVGVQAVTQPAAAAASSVERRMQLFLYWPSSAVQPAFVLHNNTQNRRGDSQAPSSQDDADADPCACSLAQAPRPGTWRVADARGAAGCKASNAGVTLATHVLLSPTSALVMMPPLKSSAGATVAASGPSACACENSAEVALSRTVAAAVDIIGSSSSGSDESVAPHYPGSTPCSEVAGQPACVAVSRLSRAVADVAEICDELHVVSTGGSGDERGADAAGDNLVLPPAVAKRLRLVLQLVQATAADIRSVVSGAASSRSSKDGDLRQAAAIAAVAAQEAAAARLDAGVMHDHFVPAAHLAAIYLPPWAPVAMPLLLAVVVGVRQVLNRRRKERQASLVSSAGSIAPAATTVATAAEADNRSSSVAAAASAADATSVAASSAATLSPREGREGRFSTANASGAAATPADSSKGGGAGGAVGSRLTISLRLPSASASTPSPSAAAPSGAASSTAASQVTAGAAAGAGFVDITLRPLRPSDTRALQRLYLLGQRQHVHDPASARAHGAWSTLLIQCGDLRDPFDYYVRRQQQRLYPGRAAFWVATVSVDDFARVLAAGAASPSSPQPSGSSSSSGASAFSDLSWLEPSLAALAADPVEPLDDDGRIMVATVGMTPYIPQAEAAAAASSAAAASDSASAAASARAPAADSGTDGPDSSSAATAAGHYDGDILADEAEGVTAAKRASRTAELIRMCVHSGLRRCGMASTLLRVVEDWCRSPGRGYDRIYLR